MRAPWLAITEYFDHLRTVRDNNGKVSIHSKTRAIGGKTPAEPAGMKVEGDGR